MNPKNPKNQKQTHTHTHTKKKKKKKRKKEKKLETHYNLYLCHKKKRGEEKRHTSKGNAESSTTECTGSERIAKKS